MNKYGSCWCGAEAGEKCVVVGGYGARRSTNQGKRQNYVHGNRELQAEAEAGDSEVFNGGVA